MEGRAVRVILITLSAALTLLLCRSVQADERTPTNKEQLIAVWHWDKEWHGTWSFRPRTGPATIEFTRNGKIKTSDKTEGTYEVAGDVLKGKLAGMAFTWKVRQLSQDELVLEEGKVVAGAGKNRFSMKWFKKK